MTTNPTDKTPEQLLREHGQRVDALFNKSRPLIPPGINDTTAWNLCDLCVRYGLDPVSGDVAWLKGGVPYVTFRGITRIAHNTGLYNGVKVEVVHMDHETNQYLVKAMVYKAGCEYPFEDFGDSETTNRQVAKMGKLKIATTRAKCRALRSAFPVELPVDGDSEEEMKDLLERAGVTVAQSNQQPAPRQPAQAKTQPTQTTHATKQTSQDSGVNGASRHPQSAPGEAKGQPQSNTGTSHTQPSSPPNDGPNTSAWNEAKKELGQLMKDFQISGSQVREVSMEMHGRGASSELNARELKSLVFVLREEHGTSAAAHTRPTGPVPPPDRAP